MKKFEEKCEDIAKILVEESNDSEREERISRLVNGDFLEFVKKD